MKTDLTKAILFILLAALVYAGVTFRQRMTQLVQELPSAVPSLSTPPPPELIQLTFVGDMMFDRHIRDRAEERAKDGVISYDFILEPIAPLLQTSDLVIGNLEGPITTTASVSQGSIVGSPRNYTFTFDPAILATLDKYHIRLVNLGNNHINNMGKNGINQTLEYLKNSPIHFFGYYQDQHSLITTSYVYTVGTYDIAFISYNQFTSGGEEYTHETIQAYQNNPEIETIVVYTHWGNEYQTVAPPVIVELAHSWVEAGADLIIGSHPHVIQNQEIYQNTPIYYSLGNFIFDQYFQPEVQRGQVVQVTIDPSTKTLTTSEQYVRLNKDGRVTLEE